VILSFVLITEARKSGSIALEGDAKHLISDVLSSLGVVVGLFLATLTGWYVLDPILAIVMAVIIARMGINVIIKSSRDLMDQSSPESEQKIREELDGMDGFIEYHDIKTRKSGNRVYAELHLCVSGDMSVRSSHDLAEAIESKLKKAVPGLVVTIHIETEEQCAKAH
ncbi:MAG: cation diffusion facilitator family transporter, partial [Methanomassiliicoccales archaeon]